MRINHPVLPLSPQSNSDICIGNGIQYNLPHRSSTRQDRFAARFAGESYLRVYMPACSGLMLDKIPVMPVARMNDRWYRPCEMQCASLTVDQREKTCPYFAAKGLRGTIRLPAALRLQNAAGRNINTRVIFIERMPIDIPLHCPGIRKRQGMVGVSARINRHAVSKRTHDKGIGLISRHIGIHYEEAIAVRSLNCAIHVKRMQKRLGGLRVEINLNIPGCDRMSE